ncbi:MAG: hypothetical protein JWQ30_703 [Sediminibacterium sp.]|nr:hypothetical protein [Sediminibacterium sp.]
MKTSNKFLSLLVVSALLFSFTKPVYQTNFSGTWALNEGKSELGQFGGRGAASKIVVDQKADVVTTTRTITGFDGTTSDVTENLSEGKESETTMFGTAKKKSVLKWAADGNTFTIASNTSIDRNGQSFEFKGSETWSLAADGKTLTLQNTFSSPNGDIITKAVYDKK